MINLDLDKGKQSLEFSNTMMTPIRSHQESTIEILQSTFEHININPLFDEPPSINGTKNLLKYPKRMLRIDFNHIIQQQDVPKGTYTLGMPNMLPNVMTSNVMEPPMSIPCETLISKPLLTYKGRVLFTFHPFLKGTHLIAKVI